MNLIWAIVVQEWAACICRSLGHGEEECMLALVSLCPAGCQSEYDKLWLLGHQSMSITKAIYSYDHIQLFLFCLSICTQRNISAF